jgi:two-component system phosphate regulon response regulator PhoB
MIGRIVIVDHDRSFLERIPELLRDQDLAVNVFTDGFDALCEVRKDRPDVLFISTRLSGLTGIQLAALLRLSAETRDIPVILLTEGGADEEEMRAARICSVKKWIKKPLDASELRDSVKAVLRERGPVAKEGGVPADQDVF